MNVTHTARPPDMTCAHCGGRGFQTVERAAGQSFVCKNCRRTYRKKSTSGSGVIAGPVYHRTREL